MNNKVYEELTQKFIDMIEAGQIPWEKTWSIGGKAFNHTSNTDYNLLNQMLLSKDGDWDTFNGWNKAGAQIKKGEKASYIVTSWKTVYNNETGKAVTDKALIKEVLTKGFYRIGAIVEIDGVEYRISFCLKWVAVFHIDQVQPSKKSLDAGITEIKSRREKVDAAELEPEKAAEDLIAAYTKREHLPLDNSGSMEAYYQPSRDRVVIPALNQYNAACEYYSTAFHELTHSTGHKSRLNRKIENAFGTQAYAREELIAEMGSAFILNTLGISTEKTERNNAAYLQNWLGALKNDSKLIYNACAGAEKAANFIMA